MKRQPPRITDDAIRLLCSHDWPGNVRELSNCIENAVVHSEKDILDADDFSRCAMGINWSGPIQRSQKKYTALFQKNYILVMLKRNKDSLTRTAEEMGITRQGLVKMMKSCGLRDDDEL